MSAAIIAGWQEYLRVLDKYLADPFGYTDLSETQSVTTDEEQQTIIRAIELYREHNLRSLGGLTFDSLTVGEIQDRGDGRREALLSYCVDRSQSAAVTYDGDPFPTDHLIPRFSETTLMVEGHDGIWRVGLVRNRQEPC